MRALASSMVAGEASPSAQDSEQYISSPVVSVWRPRTLSPSMPRRMLLCRRSFLVAGDCIGHPIVALEERPRCRCPAVVEDRLAGQLDLDLALDALHGADEHMVGAVVGRRSGVRCHAILADTRPHGERVAHHHPSTARVPRRDERIGSRFIGARVRDGHAEGSQPEAAGLAVEQGGEHAGRIEPRHAEPVDRSVRSDERAGVAIRQERVVGDRGERRGGGRALCCQAALMTALTAA